MRVVCRALHVTTAGLSAGLLPQDRCMYADLLSCLQCPIRGTLNPTFEEHDWA